jgi:RHS repeat-associated protein
MTYTYSTGATDNNGNVRSQTIDVPTIGSVTGYSATQTYEYDSLNRIQSMSETGGLNQSFDYDRYGNRIITAGFMQNANVPHHLAESDPALSGWYDQTTNRLSTEKYDDAGNITKDTPGTSPGNTFDYDAENKQTKYNGGAAADGTDYLYDGDGRRVKKVSGVYQQATVFVYDAMGKMVAEYGSNPPAGGTSYFTEDSLGTPRIITDQDGRVEARHDYLPFGEELGSGIGGRTTAQRYGAADGVRQQFTGKERDTETGLDYFEARYYGSEMGRFITPDPYMPSAEVTNPQTWNRYAYCLNNPLNNVDPTGLAYSDLDEAQRKLFDTYTAQYNKDHKSDLSAEQVYGTLDESQQATYEANTFAMEHTILHDKKGNELGNALSLVKSVDQIVGDNIGGKTHFRLYATLTDKAVETLDKSREFDHSSDIFGLHGEYSESYRSKGIPSIQVSYNPDAKTRGDIDIDYRSENPLKREGHTKHYNSDIRQVGPETDKNGSISNYQRYNNRWPNLRQWWVPKTHSNDYFSGKK